MSDLVPVVVRPMQWGVLQELQDLAPLDAGDRACMAELRDVLARHGKLSRFALHLAHRHFEVGEGEALIERPDPDGRTQHVSVGRLADFPDAVPTTWLFDGLNAAAGATYCVCVTTTLSAGACVAHGASSSPPPKKIEQDGLAERNHQQDKAKQEIGWPAGGHDGFEMER